MNVSMSSKSGRLFLRKKYLLPVLVLLLAASCTKTQPVSVGPTPTLTPTATPALDWQTYSYLPYNFSFSYPKDFVFTQPANYNGFFADPIVQLVPKNNQYPGTNYLESIFTVSAGFSKTLEQCLKPVDGSIQTQRFKTTQTINGQVFYKAQTGGAAAGNEYYSDVYRTLHKNICVEISLTIHTGNIGNYPDENHIKEIDQAKPRAILEQMLQTFTFTK